MDMGFLSELKDLSIGVAAVLGILFVFWRILILLIDGNKDQVDAMTKEREELLNERKQNQEWFIGYVNENNHQKSDMIKEYTRSVTETSKNIEANTKALESHSRIIERLIDRIEKR